jgi:hypothetical protein
MHAGLALGGKSALEPAEWLVPPVYLGFGKLYQIRLNCQGFHQHSRRMVRKAGRNLHRKNGFRREGGASRSRSRDGISLSLRDTRV